MYEQVKTKQNGAILLVKFPGRDTPEDARLLTGANICIKRSQLPALENNEYYWSDLQGLTVINTENINLGVVNHLLTVGNNDVLVVKDKREYLIPYLMGQYVLSVDLANKVIRVDWDVDF